MDALCGSQFQSRSNTSAKPSETHRAWATAMDHLITSRLALRSNNNSPKIECLRCCCAGLRKNSAMSYNSGLLYSLPFWAAGPHTEVAPVISQWDPPLELKAQRTNYFRRLWT